MNILFPYMARWKSINWTRYHNLLTEFAKRGHKIYIIQPPPLKSNETNFLEIEIEVHKNIHLINLDKILLWNINLPFSKILKKGIYTYVLSKKINEYIKKFNIDLVILYNIPQYLIIKNLKDKTNIIFDISDDYPEMLKYEIKILGSFIKKLGENYLKEMINMVDLVVVSSNGLKEKYCKIAYLIPNGVDLEMIKHYKKETNNKKIIGFIGSFEYFIDFNLIFYLAKNLNDIDFILVGNGRLFNRIKNYIERNKIENILLTDSIPHQEIYKYLNKFDIALLPFKKDEISDNACPLKLFEYTLFKIPIVSNNLKEIRNIGDEFVNFYDNYEDALKIIKDIFISEEKYMKKIEIGFIKMKERYNWKILSEEYLNLINNLS